MIGPVGVGAAVEELRVAVEELDVVPELDVAPELDVVPENDSVAEPVTVGAAEEAEVSEALYL